MASSASTGRLEDVYQEEVINSFVDLTQFKMFARSKNGLCLAESDVQNCDEDNKNSIDKKMAMLRTWQMKNGKDATVSRIRYLVERYHTGDTPINYMTLREGLFGLFKDKTLCKYSQVYLGEQISTVVGSIPRAIKLIQYEENSLREAQILTKLGTHENVVSVIHVDKCRGELHDYIYIVMELVSSENLRDLLEKTKKLKTVLDDETVIDMAIQIMKALVFIHKKNIIHRDLKPENILLSDDGKVLKLTDFGISKTISSGSYTKQTNKEYGTDGYQSPESYNEDVISQKSDIFSAGITLTELFSNSQHPFGDEPDLWKYFIKTYKTPDTSHMCIANKAPVENLIGRMLLFDPEERPTALEVLKKLRRFLETITRSKVHSTSHEKLKKVQLAEDFRTLSVHMHPEESRTGNQFSEQSIASSEPSKDKEIRTIVEVRSAQLKVQPGDSTNEVQLMKTSDTHAMGQMHPVALTTGESWKEVQLLEKSASIKQLPEKAPQVKDTTPTSAPRVNFKTSSAKTKEIILFNWNDKHMHSFGPLTKEWKQEQAYHVYSGYDGDCFATLLYGRQIYSLHHNEIHKLNYTDTKAKWNQVKNMRRDHGRYPPATVLNGSIHVCGSYGEVSQSVERFEERKNIWIALPPYQVARMRHCLASSKDHIYCIGGRNANRGHKLPIERFDGERWEFVNKQAPRGLTDASAAVLEEQIYVADNGVLCYNIQTDSWHVLNLSPK